MDYFNYKENQLFAEDVPVRDIVAQVGSPCYIYSRATLERHWHAFNDSFAQQPHLVCYAVKANSNLAVLNVMARLGSGFDIVSAGELRRVLAAGGRADRIVFSGVGKTADEMSFALQQGIHCFNVESEAELYRLAEIAQKAGLPAPVALRVNPDVDAQTHPYISTGLKENKFGIDIDQAQRLYQWAANQASLKIKGIACHIGSQLTTLAPFLDALDRVLALRSRLIEQGIHCAHLDIGGGLGVRYRDENPPQPADYAKAIRDRLADEQVEIHMEPGRAIAANAGILVTRVEYLKHTEHKDFAVVDAAMNDMMRPALYQAWMELVPVMPHGGESREYDIVGPVCETGDFLAKSRRLILQEGDLLAMRSAGAYGFSMSSNYNTRGRVAEVMVDGDKFHVVRQRETFEDMIRGETILP